MLTATDSDAPLEGESEDTYRTPTSTTHYVSGNGEPRTLGMFGIAYKKPDIDLLAQAAIELAKQLQDEEDGKPPKPRISVQSDNASD